jgi:hypothetical protein
VIPPGQKALSPSQRLYEPEAGPAASNEVVNLGPRVKRSFWKLIHYGLLVLPIAVFSTCSGGNPHHFHGKLFVTNPFIFVCLGL